MGEAKNNTVSNQDMNDPLTSARSKKKQFGLGTAAMNSTLKVFILTAGMTGLFLVSDQALGGEQEVMLVIG